MADGDWTETVLHNFGNGTDGNSPEATLIIDAAGNLYGTTDLGGVDGRGTVFELSPGEGGGWTETVLHNFSYNHPDGAFPGAGLIMDAAGNLYGTTSGGGYFGTGRLRPTGLWNGVRTVADRRGGLDGDPLVSLPRRGRNGSLRRRDHGYRRKSYGATHVAALWLWSGLQVVSYGGGGWTETVLHSFGSGTDGKGPYGDLVMDGAGNLYGTRSPAVRHRIAAAVAAWCGNHAIGAGPTLDKVAGCAR